MRKSLLSSGIETAHQEVEKGKRRSRSTVKDRRKKKVKSSILSKK